jgi:hypothetical protein
VGALATANSDDSEDLYRGVAVGSALGLLVAFAASVGIDDIPADTPLIGEHSSIAPTTVPMTDSGGHTRLALGLGGTW